MGKPVAEAFVGQRVATVMVVMEKAVVPAAELEVMGNAV